MTPEPGDDRRILLAHGGGGVMMREFIAELILRRLGNPTLARLEDAAVLKWPPNPSGRDCTAAPAPPSARLAFTTDAFVVKPLFFRGGDIGRLAVCGTVNDLAAMGARPLALSLALIIEEGLAFSTLDRVLESVATAASEAGVEVVTGDTKVVERGAADGLFLITAGIGAVPDGVTLSPSEVRPGDAVIASGTLGDHGIAIVSERNGLEFETPVRSDVAPLGGLVAHLFCHQNAKTPRTDPSNAQVNSRSSCLGDLAAKETDFRSAVHCMRDPTRGGAAAVLHEIAAAAGVEIEVQESLLPIRPEVAAACDMLGFDSLYVPCEGRLILFCAQDAAEEVVLRLRRHPLGAGAVRVGTVRRGQAGRVVLNTRVGGTRLVTAPYGEQLPRIC